MIKQHWWKITGIALIIYALVVGVLIPLKPAVEKLSVTSAASGDTVRVKVFGYNTYFKQATDVNVWLKFDSVHLVKGRNIQLITDQQLEVSFALPQFLPTKAKVQDATMIIDTDADGSFPYPGAIAVAQDSINPAMATATEKIGKLHEVPFTNFPFRNILQETIRCLYYHVPLWFAMMILLAIACIYAVKYLLNPQEKTDYKIVGLTNVGLLFGILGLITGAIWANYTWGKPWSFDVKQNMAAVCVLIYAAYFVLRGAFDDETTRNRISAVYSIFAFVAMIPLLFVIPRLTDSLHPGNGGNPALGSQDLDNTMRMVFYPAIIGFTLLGYWLADLWSRALAIQAHLLED
jgi:heme exporter protein C